MDHFSFDEFWKNAWYFFVGPQENTTILFEYDDCEDIVKLVGKTHKFIKNDHENRTKI
jgi:hypothetical protein